MTPMTDNEEWISAAEALRILKIPYGFSARETICKRAHAGMVRARAEKIILNNKPQETKTVPKMFWWAKGEAALTQNWRAGDFSTWIEHKDHIEVFGVEFVKSELEKLLPKTSEVEVSAESAVKKYSNRVFIVHGRDEGPRESVATFLRTFELEPVILNTLPSRSRAVIEKIEENSDVGFAVVLLTPDDEGGLAGGAMKPRARQNVLLELGYFMGLLNRERVCALVKGDVEIPSDWAGVINTHYDDLSQGWKFVLARELKQAGYSIDLNKMV
jgi:predicted nucleotide-binding protein